MASRNGSCRSAGVARRTFLAAGVGAAGTAWAAHLPAAALNNRSQLQAGEAAIDIAPPVGIEMGGFHRPAGMERRIAGIRQTPQVRALCLAHGDMRVVVISLDILAVDQAMTGRVQRAVSERTGVPAANVRLCATHSHSMPTFRYCRQWGAIPGAYQALVEQKTIEAAALAAKDLAAAELYVGKSRASGANFNRTTPKHQIDAEFNAQSSDDVRWVDTTVHALRFARTGGKPDLLWYHFSAHPVCYTDDQAGPDWPGLVAQRLAETRKLRVSYLQGHIGDVNPGPGKPWLGVPEDVATRVADALGQAIDAGRPAAVDALRVERTECQLPLDIARLREWLAAYPRLDAKAKRGAWVDEGFAADWFRTASQWDLTRDRLAAPLSAMRIGELALAFHPAELYSHYGLAIRRDSPFRDTVAVGYADGLIGYLPDPAAFAAGEYSALVVPKILDLPPFAPTAAREMTLAVGRLLKRLAG